MTYRSGPSDLAVRCLNKVVTGGDYIALIHRAHQHHYCNPSGYTTVLNDPFNSVATGQYTVFQYARLFWKLYL